MQSVTIVAPLAWRLRLVVWLAAHLGLTVYTSYDKVRR